MELRYVTEFKVLAELGSYSRASEELLISQPSLTKHIQALETELGEKLFNRSTHGIALSEFGELFLPFAERISEEQDNFEYEAQSFKRRKAASFTVGIVHTMQYYNVAKYMLAFREQYPTCIINAIELEENKLFSELQNKHLNMITCAVPFGEKPALPYIPVAESNIVAVTSQDHPFANVQKLDMRTLDGESLIIPARTDIFSRYIRQTFKALNVKPNIIYEGTSAGSLELARAGLGISLQSRELVEGQNDPAIRPIPLDPPMKYTYGLMYRDDTGLSVWEHRFIDYLKSAGLKE